MKKIILAVAILALVGCNAEHHRITKIHLSDKEKEAIEVFKAYKCKNPVELGIAVTKTKYPRILTAIAIVESRGDINAVGDSGKAKGAFQVWGKHWGEVPNTATEQAKQAERILDSLIDSKRNLRRGLAAYNGGDRPPKVAFNYADRVMRISRGVRL